jgi:Archaeal/vacuolar-type H+-ATPase subunit A
VRKGYPAYLATRLSEFYERAGRAIPLGTDKVGSATVIGAVSPPGGDFSEPVTQNTLRVTKVFWALDAKLAQRRHFPSINWLTSYSLYGDLLGNWYAENIAEDWGSTITQVTTLLQEEEKLMEIVQLVGSDALPEKQQLLLEAARLLREFFLQQNAFHDVDTFSEMKKTYRLMKAILNYYELAQVAMDKGARVKDIVTIKSKDEIGNAKFERDYNKVLDKAEAKIKKDLESLEVAK